MDIKEIIERLENPKGTIRDRLDRLQRDFTPNGISMLLNMDKDLEFEETLQSYVESLERLEAYAQNGYSNVGLEKYIGYKEVVGL